MKINDIITQINDITQYSYLFGSPMPGGLLYSQKFIGFQACGQ